MIDILCEYTIHYNTIKKFELGLNLSCKKYQAVNPHNIILYMICRTLY